MSYVALATNDFAAATTFYGRDLGLPVIAGWDRPTGRGRRFDLFGLKLEILDNSREGTPLALEPSGDRTHLVAEVEDVDAWHAGLAIDAPPPRVVSWGAKLFQVRDPDGVPITFLEWLGDANDAS